MEKFKLSLVQKWVLSKPYSFVHSSVLLGDGRAVVLTSDLEDCDKYTVLLLSSSGIREVAIYDCSDERRNYPVLFSFETGFGILQKGKQLEYYANEFSAPEVIEIKNRASNSTAEIFSGGF